MPSEDNRDADTASASVEAAATAVEQDLPQELEKVASDLQIEMEQSAQRIRDLILAQPPLVFWAIFGASFF